MSGAAKKEDKQRKIVVYPLGFYQLLYCCRKKQIDIGWYRPVKK